jgi:hypothetical protein
LAREGNPDPPIPSFVKSLIEYLDTKADAEGIFRIAGSRSSMETLRTQIDKGSKLDFNAYQEYQSVHTLASLLKLFFRLLPEPLLTFDVYDPLISLSEKAVDADDLAKRMGEIFSGIPYVNRYLARYLMEFLARVSTKSQVNMMCAITLLPLPSLLLLVFLFSLFLTFFSFRLPSNLAICFAPNLLRPREESISTGPLSLPLPLSFSLFCPVVCLLPIILALVSNFVIFLLALDVMKVNKLVEALIINPKIIPNKK